MGPPLKRVSIANRKGSMMTNLVNAEVSSHGKVLAAGAYLVSIPVPVFGPLVAAMMFPRGTYERHHAWRALRDDLIVFGITALVALIFIGHTIWTLWNASQQGLDSINWWSVILKPVLWWILAAIFGLINTISSLRAAYLAYFRPK